MNAVDCGEKRNKFLTRPTFSDQNTLFIDQIVKAPPQIPSDRWFEMTFFCSTSVISELIVAFCRL